MQDAGFKVSQPFRPEGLPVPGDVLLDTLDGFGVAGPSGKTSGSYLYSVSIEPGFCLNAFSKSRSAASNLRFRSRGFSSDSPFLIKCYAAPQNRSMVAVFGFYEATTWRSSGLHARASQALQGPRPHRDGLDRNRQDPAKLRAAEAADRGVAVGRYGGRPRQAHPLRGVRGRTARGTGTFCR